jgi:F-type H+-transporting ATPase subunit b
MNDLLFSKTFQETFEFNTNIFETNLINLSIVLLIVIRFLGEALSNLLESRRQFIIKNLEDSNKKILLVKDELINTRTQLGKVKNEMTAIYDTRLVSFNNKKEIYLNQVESYSDQLKRLRNDIIDFQTKKVLTDVYDKLIKQTFTYVSGAIKFVLYPATETSMYTSMLDSSVYKIGKPLRTELKLNYLRRMN